MPKKKLAALNQFKLAVCRANFSSGPKEDPWWQKSVCEFAPLKKITPPGVLCVASLAWSAGCTKDVHPGICIGCACNIFWQLWQEWVEKPTLSSLAINSVPAPVPRHDPHLFSAEWDYYAACAQISYSGYFLGYCALKWVLDMEYLKYLSGFSEVMFG